MPEDYDEMMILKKLKKGKFITTLQKVLMKKNSLNALNQGEFYYNDSWFIPIVIKSHL